MTTFRSENNTLTTFRCGDNLKTTCTIKTTLTTFRSEDNTQITFRQQSRLKTFSQHSEKKAFRHEAISMSQFQYSLVSNVLFVYNVDLLQFIFRCTFDGTVIMDPLEKEAELFLLLVFVLKIVPDLPVAFIHLSYVTKTSCFLIFSFKQIYMIASHMIIFI